MDESHKQNVKTEKKTEYILYEVKIESTLEGIFNLLGEKHKWDSENGLYFDLGGSHLWKFSKLYTQGLSILDLT